MKEIRIELTPTEELLETVLEALADIGDSEDMTSSQRRAKARRVYRDIRKDFNPWSNPQIFPLASFSRFRNPKS